MEVVAELIGPGLGQALDALARLARRMVAGRRARQAGEDLLESALPDLALAAAGELELALAIALDQVLLLERGEEAVEIDLLGDVALLLQVAHPLHRLLDVAARGQHQLVEQPQQVEAGEELPDQLGIEVEVLVTHGPLAGRPLNSRRPGRCPAGRCRCRRAA